MERKGRRKTTMGCSPPAGGTSIEKRDTRGITPTRVNNRVLSLEDLFDLFLIDVRDERDAADVRRFLGKRGDVVAGDKF